MLALEAVQDLDCPGWSMCDKDPAGGPIDIPVIKFAGRVAREGGEFPHPK
jgi:hypothetical protein